MALADSLKKHPLPLMLLCCVSLLDLGIAAESLALCNLACTLGYDTLDCACSGRYHEQALQRTDFNTNQYRLNQALQRLLRSIAERSGPYEDTLEDAELPSGIRSQIFPSLKASNLPMPWNKRGLESNQEEESLRPPFRWGKRFDGGPALSHVGSVFRWGKRGDNTEAGFGPVFRWGKRSVDGVSKFNGATSDVGKQAQRMQLSQSADHLQPSNIGSAISDELRWKATNDGT